MTATALSPLPYHTRRLNLIAGACCAGVRGLTADIGIIEEAAHLDPVREHPLLLQPPPSPPRARTDDSSCCPLQHGRGSKVGCVT